MFTVVSAHKEEGKERDRSEFDSYDAALQRYTDDLKSGRFWSVRLSVVLLEWHNGQRTDPFTNTPFPENFGQ